MKSILLALVISASLSACSMTLPVRGQIQNSSETFNGSATGYMNGSGDLTINTSKGSKCTGNFVYITSRKGEGVFTCDDGRSGPFEFVSTGSNGTGHGSLSDEKLIFTFGK